MSRITQKPAVGAISPFIAPTTNTGNSNYTGTATPAVSYEAFSANPANGAQPATGTGFYDPNFVTYVGQKFETSDGRELVLIQNGATALTAGKLLTTSAEVTGFHDLAITVPTAYPATAGTVQVLVTNGSTVLNVNQFQGGYLAVEEGTGAGQMLKIASHAPAANAATFVVTLEDALQTTLTTSSKVSLLANPYQGVVITTHGSPTGAIAVTLTPIAGSTAATYDATYGTLTTPGVNQYGLAITHGPAVCLIDSTTTIGYPLGPAVTNYDGALQVATLTTSPQVAISLQTQVSNKYGLVYMML
jgi:hypothetical protein